MIKENREVTNSSTRYEVIDKNGRYWDGFYSAASAAEWARKNFPDQERDEDRTGRGWDIQVAGIE